LALFGIYLAQPLLYLRRAKKKLIVVGNWRFWKGQTNSMLVSEFAKEAERAIVVTRV
jgi:hypothetical protein